MFRGTRHATRVWDLPTRVFHWLLAALMIFSWASGQIGGVDWLMWHFRAGYAVFALLVFRVLWGFAGSRYALFSTFRLSLAAAIAHLRAPRPVAGHSPAGAWSVALMLVAAALQVITGLLSSDGDFTEGPWAPLVSQRTVEWMSSVHSFNRWVLLALVFAHVAAIGWYHWRGVPMTGSMWNGTLARVAAEPTDDDLTLRLRALVFVALASGLVATVVLL